MFVWKPPFQWNTPARVVQEWYSGLGHDCVCYGKGTLHATCSRRRLKLGSAMHAIAPITHTPLTPFQHTHVYVSRTCAKTRAREGIMTPPGASTVAAWRSVGMQSSPSNPLSSTSDTIISGRRLSMRFFPKRTQLAYEDRRLALLLCVYTGNSGESRESFSRP